MLTALETGKNEIDFAYLGDALTYNIEGEDYVNIDLLLGLGTAWPGSGVVTVRIAFNDVDFDDFSGGAVTYTSVGNKTRLEVTGAKRLRIFVSTKTGSAGAVTLKPRVKSTRLRP